jgi:hypothetical protein
MSPQIVLKFFLKVEMIGMATVMQPATARCAWLTQCANSAAFGDLVELAERLNRHGLEETETSITSA